MECVGWPNWFMQGSSTIGLFRTNETFAENVYFG